MKPDISAVYKETLSFRNFLASEDRCSEISVRIKTKVFSDGGQEKEYRTNFSLNPEGCTKVKDGVDFKEKCFAFVDVDSIETTTDKNESTDKNNSTGDQEENDKRTPLPAILGTSMGVIIGASVGGGLLLLLLLIAAGWALRKRMTKQKIKEETFRADENHVYGTYSRGSVDGGEYGDGDVVEFTDTNDYYG